VVELHVGGSHAEISLFGGHVFTLTVDNGARKVIYLSPRAVLDQSKAIRGGIPICWPQFGPHGPLQQHGFARNSVWNLVETSTGTENSFAKCVLSLESSEDTLKSWNHPFKLTLTAILSENNLELDWNVTNTSSDSEFEMSGALHSYFSVADVTKSRVTGLNSGTDKGKYLDNTKNLSEGITEDGTVYFIGEFDRVYLNSGTELIVEEELNGKYSPRIKITKSVDLPDAVVWNPGAEKSQDMKDLGVDQYTSFVCVEPALFNKISLSPNSKWNASFNIKALKNTNA